MARKKKAVVGRSRQNDAVKVTYALRMDPELVQALDAYLDGSMPRTAYIERAIAQGLQDAGETLPGRWAKRLELGG